MSRTLFTLAFPLAAPFWALMILAPGWSWTRRVARSPLIVLAPLAAYLAAVVPILPRLAAEMVSPDLAGVRDLLATSTGTTVVWAHLIAFDLFIGRWMYLDGRDRRISPLIMSPILLLTIFLSPFGLLAYLAVRAGRPAAHGDIATPPGAVPAPRRPAGPRPRTGSSAGLTCRRPGKDPGHPAVARGRGTRGVPPCSFAA